METAQGSPAGIPPGALAAPLGSSDEAIAQTLALPGATWLNDRDGDRLFDTLEARFAAAPLSPQPAIVTFVHGADADAMLAAAQAAAGPFPLTHHYRAFGGFAAQLTAVQAAAIASLDGVRQVEWSQPGVPELDTATVTFGARAVQEGLAFPGDAEGVDAVTGDGVVVAILDTGFDGAHADLKGKFVRFIDWSDGGAEKEPYDSDQHGTHVASIAGGLGVGDPKLKGVAPGAAFVGFLISSDDTKGAAIASMDYLLAHPELGVRVSTISFGFGATVDGTDALEIAMDKAWAAGIVPFKSNGNSGPGPGSTTVPGGARGILSIGNMFDDGEGGFRLSGSSSRGPTQDGRVKPDLVAPGSAIMAAANGTGDGYVSLSGTSMASPFAAGTAALMLDADPTLTPANVRRILTSTAHEWGAAGEDNEFGAGRLDALRAVQTVLLERAVRERLPYATVAAWDVPAPATGLHMHGVLTGVRSETTFEVVAAGLPVGITVIANGTQQQVTPPAGSTVVVRAIAVQVVGPGADVLGTIPAAPNGRQNSFTFTAGEVGTYTLRAVRLAGEEQLWYDVSAGIAAETLPSVIPDEAGYLQLLGDAGATDAGEAAPAAGAFALVALLAIAVAVRRRR